MQKNPTSPENAKTANIFNKINGKAKENAIVFFRPALLQRLSEILFAAFWQTIFCCLSGLTGCHRLIEISPQGTYLTF